MICNKNEKYLLEFISGKNTLKTGEFLNIISNMGIKINFKDNNPIYKIIDELSYGNIIRK